MDSDDESFDGDSGNVSSDGGEDDFVMDVDMPNSKGQQEKEDPFDYPYEVLTTDEIVQHMTDCIKEVNTVVEVSRISQFLERNTLPIPNPSSHLITFFFSSIWY